MLLTHWILNIWSWIWINQLHLTSAQEVTSKNFSILDPPSTSSYKLIKNINNKIIPASYFVQNPCHQENRAKIATFIKKATKVGLFLLQVFPNLLCKLCTSHIFTVKRCYKYDQKLTTGKNPVLHLSSGQCHDLTSLAFLNHIFLI